MDDLVSAVVKFFQQVGKLGRRPGVYVVHQDDALFPLGKLRKNVLLNDLRAARPVILGIYVDPDHADVALFR